METKESLKIELETAKKKADIASTKLQIMDLQAHLDKLQLEE